MQLVVLDFSVQALLMGEELDSEGLVEYLEGVVWSGVGLSWFGVVVAVFVHVFTVTVCVFAVTGCVGYGGKPIELLDPLNRSQWVENTKVQIKHPEIPISQHNIHSFINLLTQLNSPHINPDIRDILQQLMIPHKVQINLIVVNKHLNPILENVNWQFNHHIPAVIWSGQKYCLKNLFRLLCYLVFADWVFVYAVL